MGSEIIGTKNNHKYFPEFVARSFYGKKPIKYLDASTGEIITVQNSNDFNAEFGYYTDENENLLNKEAEQKFQQLSRQVAKIAKSGKRDVSRLKVDPDIVYKFFAYQLWRDPTNSNATLNIFHNENILDKKMFHYNVSKMKHLRRRKNFVLLPLN